MCQCVMLLWVLDIYLWFIIVIAEGGKESQICQKWTLSSHSAHPEVSLLFYWMINFIVALNQLGAIKTWKHFFNNKRNRRAKFSWIEIIALIVLEIFLCYIKENRKGKITFNLENIVFNGCSTVHIINT